MSKLILLLFLFSCQAQVDNCNLSKYDHFLKQYKICQDPKDETLIHFKLKKTDIRIKYCFIPTYIAKGSKKSIFIGEPRCLFIKDPTKNYAIKFFKNRPSPPGAIPYENFPIKGVMILKDELLNFPPPFEKPMPAPNAYLKCAEILDLTGEDAYCQAFKEKGRYSLLAF